MVVVVPLLLLAADEDGDNGGGGLGVCVLDGSACDDSMPFTLEARVPLNAFEIYEKIF
jgi:hypothetical protein